MKLSMGKRRLRKLCINKGNYWVSVGGEGGADGLSLP